MLSYAGNISYADRSTLLSEISETGIIDAHARQQALNTGFSISDQMTERQRLGADAGFSNVKYPDGEQLGLVAYRHTSASIDYAFSVSEATTLSAVVFGAQETAPDLGFTSDDAGARIGLAWNLAPDSALSASAGASRASFASEVIYGSVWALQASHHSERTQWELTLTRDVVPTGVGYLTRRDQLDLSAVRKMTEHVDLTIRLLAAANHDVQSRVVQTDRRYFTGTAGLAWHLTEKWLMSFELRASGARYPDEPGTLDDANGWQSAVRLRWTPPIYTVSR